MFFGYSKSALSTIFLRPAPTTNLGRLYAKLFSSLYFFLHTTSLCREVTSFDITARSTISFWSSPRLHYYLMFHFMLYTAGGGRNKGDGLEFSVHMLPPFPSNTTAKLALQNYAVYWKTFNRLCMCALKLWRNKHNRNVARILRRYSGSVIITRPHSCVFQCVCIYSSFNDTVSNYT
jgi:hypothetical protein